MTSWVQEQQEVACGQTWLLLLILDHCPSPAAGLIWELNLLLVQQALTEGHMDMEWWLPLLDVRHFQLSDLLQGEEQVPLRFELRSLDSKSSMLTITPWNHINRYICSNSVEFLPVFPGLLPNLTSHDMFRWCPEESRSASVKYTQLHQFNYQDMRLFISGLWVGAPC